jgi:hypothetical protein
MNEMTVAGNAKWPDELISIERRLVETLSQSSETLSDIHLRQLNEKLELTRTEVREHDVPRESQRSHQRTGNLRT